LRSPATTTTTTTNTKSRTCQRITEGGQNVPNPVVRRRTTGFEKSDTTMVAETPDLRLSSRNNCFHPNPKLQQHRPTPSDDEFDFMRTSQPIIKSICDGSSIKQALASKHNKRHTGFRYAPRTLRIDEEDATNNNVTANNNNRPPKSSSTTTKRIQPSSHTALSDVRAFFAHLDATEELTIDNTTTMSKLHSLEQQHKRCVRTIRKRSLSDLLLLKEYALYIRANRESGLLPLALQMFASMLFCQSDGYGFSKKRICDRLLLEVD